MTPAPRVSKRVWGWAACVLCGMLGWCPLVRAQTPAVLPVPDTLPAPRRQPASAPETPLPQGAGLSLGQETAVPITLPVALRLAEIGNLDIAQAREVVNQARAALERAQVGLLPNLNLGSAYNHHEGQIQKTEGNIITANRDSLFVGGGPSMTFQVTDAIFGPLIARQATIGTEAGLQRVNNETLLAVADAYFNILRARRRLARVEETLEYLTSERRTSLRSELPGLLPLVKIVVEAGGKDAFRSDIARTEVEILRRQEEREAAVQDFRLATAELARLLRLDPALVLWPVEDIRYPLPLPGDGWSDRPVEELVAFALGNRPELVESRAQVQAALDRLHAAKSRPLLPNISLNYNWGDFGGGPDLNPTIIVPPSKPGGSVTKITQPGFGPSGRIEHFAPRTDFDVSLIWRLQNMGLGNLAEIREQEAGHRQALLRRLQAQDRVITQVVQSQELVVGWRERVAITRSALFDERGAPAGPVFRSLRLNFERIRAGEGRPLEAVDSIRGLNDLLEAYGQAVTDYERSRFRLLVALGVPPPALFPDPAATPHAPAQQR